MGKAKAGSRCVVRIVGRRTKGYQGRVYLGPNGRDGEERTGSYRSKLFSDHKCGGAKLAKVKAERWARYTPARRAS